MTSQYFPDAVASIAAAQLASGSKDKVDPVNVTVYGKTIPLLFGSARILGAPIWAAKVTDNDDGSRDVTAAYCFGHVDVLTTDAVLSRVWMDGQLAYDATNPALPGQRLAFRFYGGSEDQQPDPRIVAEEGADRTPAFRDRIYLVVEGWHVPLGATFPECTAEIVQKVTTVDGTYLTPLGNVTSATIQQDDNNNVQLYMLYDPDQGTVLARSSTDQSIWAFNVSTGELRGHAVPTIDGNTVHPSYPSRVLPEYYANTPTTVAAFDYSGNLTARLDIADLTENAGISASYATASADQYLAVYTAPVATLTLNMFRRNGDQLDLVKVWSATGFGATVAAVAPAFVDNRKVAPNNDYAMCYFASKSYLGVMFVPDGDTALVGNQLVSNNGETRTNSLYSGAVGQIVADVSSVVPGGTIVALCVDPVAAAWVACLVDPGDVSHLVYLKFRTPFALLGPQNFPAPALPPITYCELIRRRDLDFYAFLGPQFNALNNARPAGQTLEIMPGNAKRNVLFDWFDGSYTEYDASEKMTYPATGQQINGNLGRWVAWDDALGGAVYTNLLQAGTQPVPGIAALYKGQGEATATLPLASFLTSLGILGGFDKSQIVVDASVSETVVGAIIDQPVMFNDFVPALTQVFGVDFLESAGKLKFRRRVLGAAFSPDAVLLDGDLAVVDQGSDEGAILTKTRDAASSLPTTVQITYLDSDNDYSLGAQSAKRTQFPYKTSNGTKTDAYGVPVAMPAVKALYYAECVLYNRWAAALTLGLRVSQKWLALEPGDYIQIVTQQFGSYIVKLTAVALNDDYSLSITADTVLAFSPGNTTGNSIIVKPPTAEPVPPPPPTPATQYQVRVIDNFAFMPPNSPSTTATLWVFSDKVVDVVLSTLANGDTAPLTTDGSAVLGSLVNALPPIPRTFNTPDDVTRVTVKLPSVPPAGTDDDFLSGRCGVVLGGTGRWEMVWYRDVADNGDGTYTLSHILRGQQGTSSLSGAPGAGDAAILATRAGFVPVSYPTPPSGENAALRANLAGQGVYAAGAKTVGVRLLGSDLKPWMPLHLAGSTNSDGSVTFTWDRQDRIAYTLHDNDGDIPLSEASEVYAIDFMAADGSVAYSVRNITAPTYTLDSSTASQYGISLTAPRMRVAEVSAAVGVGFSRVITCQVN